MLKDTGSSAEKAGFLGCWGVGPVGEVFENLPTGRIGRGTASVAAQICNLAASLDTDGIRLFGKGGLLCAQLGSVGAGAPSVRGDGYAATENAGGIGGEGNKQGR